MWFPPKPGQPTNSKIGSGVVQFDSVEASLEALVLANNSRLEGPRYYCHHYYHCHSRPCHYKY